MTDINSNLLNKVRQYKARNACPEAYAYARSNTAQQHSTAGTAQHDTAQLGTAQHDMAWDRTAQHSTVQHSTAAPSGFVTAIPSMPDRFCHCWWGQHDR